MNTVSAFTSIWTIGYILLLTVFDDEDDDGPGVESERVLARVSVREMVLALSSAAALMAVEEQKT